jgi:DNA replication protein DnaC
LSIINLKIILILLKFKRQQPFEQSRGLSPPSRQRSEQDHEVIGEKTLAEAILDRIVHQSIRIELYGESLRKKQLVKAEIMESYL